MEILIVLLVILQTIAVSLGVGSSTIAITNFFVAIADGTIDETERKMMGVVYTVLRVAMGLILVTTVGIGAFLYLGAGANYFSPFILMTWTLIAVLFINAVLMTKHIMPSKVGPALQAGTWYSLGILMSLVPLGLTGFSYVVFLIGYALIVVIALAAVNGTMQYLKKKKETTPAM